MKKLISAALALLVGVSCAALVGCSCKSCGNKNGNNDSDEKIAESAINQIKYAYDNPSYANTESSFAVLGKISVNSVLYTVDWEIKAVDETVDITQYIKISEEMDEELLYTVSVTTRPADEDIPYTLTATVTISESVSKSHTISRTLKKLDKIYTVAEMLALDQTKVMEYKYTNTNTGKEVTNKYYSEDGTTAAVLVVEGYVVDTGTWSNSNANFTDVYIADTYTIGQSKSGALQVYRLKKDEVYLKGENDLLRGDKVTLQGCLQVYNGNWEMTYISSATQTVNVNCIGIKKADRTDAQKVAEARQDVTISQKVFNETGELDDLMTTSIYGATYTWSVDGTSEYVEIVDNVLNIKALPTSAQDITLKIAVNSGEVTEYEYITITVAPAGSLGLMHAGTAADPFSAADVAKICTSLETSFSGNYHYYSDEQGNALQVYVKGYVTVLGSWSSSAGRYNNMYIADVKGASQANSLNVYSLSAKEGTALENQNDVKEGDEIIVYGFIVKFGNSNTNEITFKEDDVVTAYSINGNLKGSGTDDPDEGEATLKFVEANRTSYSTEEQVWKANGITLTNTKGSGDKDNDVGDFKNPVRLYPNSKVKIEYTSEINELLFNCATSSDKDYATVLQQSLASVTGATVSKDGTKVTVTFASPVTSIEFTCTAQIRLASIVVNPTNSGTGGGGAVTGTFTPITTIAAGEYYYAINKDGTVYYMTGDMSDYYFATSTDVTKAVKVNVIADGDGWIIKQGTRFIEIEVSGTHNNVKFNEAQTPNKHWEWNAEQGVLTWTLESGTKLFLGTSGNYTTFSASDLGYLTGDKTSDRKNYIAQFGTFTEGSGDSTGGGGTGENPPAGTTNYGTLAAPLSVTEALALATEECKSDKDVTKQVVYMQGKVTDAGTEKSGNSGKYYQEVYITDLTDTSKKILVYTLNLGTGITSFSVGDEVVICGYIKNYQGTIEFATNGSTQVNVVKSSASSSSGGGTGDNQPTDGAISFAFGGSTVTKEEADQVIWSSNGITVTNDKGGAKSDLNVYGDGKPSTSTQARFFKYSKVKIDCTGMTKIVFHCQAPSGTSTYAAWLKTQLDVANISGATITVSGNDVTIVFASAVNSIEFVCDAGQVRVNTMDVYTAD